MREGDRFEVEEMREANLSLSAQIRELEQERANTLDNMATIINKNEDLQKEINILTKALDLQSQAQ